MVSMTLNNGEHDGLTRVSSLLGQRKLIKMVGWNTKNRHIIIKAWVHLETMADESLGIEQRLSAVMSNCSKSVHASKADAS
jgi:hypothetical protein